MWKFILGILVAVAFYNQAKIERGSRIIARDFHLVARVVQANHPYVYKAKIFESRKIPGQAYVARFKGEAPSLDTTTEIKEPSVEKLGSLGIRRL